MSDTELQTLRDTIATLHGVAAGLRYDLDTANKQRDDAQRDSATSRDLAAKLALDVLQVIERYNSSKDVQEFGDRMEGIILRLEDDYMSARAAGLLPAQEPK